MFWPFFRSSSGIHDTIAISFWICQWIKMDLYLALIGFITSQSLVQILIKQCMHLYHWYFWQAHYSINIITTMGNPYILYDIKVQLTPWIILKKNWLLRVQNRNTVIQNVIISRRIPAQGVPQSHLLQPQLIPKTWQIN
jgi:hypothetical protein